ncbi:class I SAM-dependent methyltransferase [Cryptosporangium sp. NPDC051539]|uniref:class I SAM-dependent methyltransferase n=1 Tax=Cryptosporangium sp. NPDC051539 TaxID=3363962 RepID=UPI0037AC9F85
MTSDVLSFLTEFVRHPLTTGAVAPSGRTLAGRITTPVPRTGSPCVVELGPGTGAFTAPIHRLLADGGRHVAVEVNARFVRRLARRYPSLELHHADATELGALDLPPADAVISGLPWTVFPAARQDTILDAVRDLLTDAGTFTTFAYVHAAWTPPGRRLRTALHARFEEVVPGRTVWSNLPPAFVYHARRPIRRSLEGVPVGAAPGDAGRGLVRETGPRPG